MIGIGQRTVASHDTQWMIRKPRPAKLSDEAHAKRNKAESSRVIEIGDEANPTRDDFDILGPYLTEQVLQMIQEEVLGPEDEVCPEGGYWFSLDEHEEVIKHFGVDRITEPALVQSDATLPGTGGIGDAAGFSSSTSEQAVHPRQAAGGSTQASPSSESIRQAPNRPLTVLKDPRTGTPYRAEPTITDLKIRFPRSTGRSLGYYGKVSSPQILGVEKGRVWRILFVVLTAVATYGVIWVLRSLQS